MAKFKGFEVEILDEPLHAVPETDDAYYYDRDFVIKGVAVILEYLDERHPLPCMYPREPQERAVTRCLLNEIISATCENAALDSFIPPAGFVAGKAPSVLDIAVAPSAMRGGVLLTKVSEYLCDLSP